MPAPMVPDTAALEVRCALDGQDVENTLWFRKTTGTVDSENLKALCTTVRVWFVTDVLPKLPAAVTFREVYGRDRGFPDGVEGSSATGAGTAGGIAIAATPNNVSLSVSFRTGRTGRSRRGRNYWLAIPGNKVTANVVDNLYIDDIISSYEELLTVVGPDWEWVVVSLRSNNNWRETALVTPITEVLVVDDVVDSQRRRLPGRGQ